MVDKNLLKKVNQLGFALMEAQAEFDVNKTLAEVVKSHDTRLWEGFPVLLVNAVKTGDFETKKVGAYLTNEADRQKWRKLLVMSLGLYRAMNKVFNFAEQLRKTLAPKETRWFKEFWPRMRRGENFKLDNKEFNSSRLETLMDNYMREEALKAQKIQAKSNDLSLEYALSQVFSPKQKELFRKKLNSEPLTKTEREYFSRAVKKKVLALANDELHNLARRLLHG